jgi:hypothetical protein
MLLAGCGIDWFPAPTQTFTNNSTVTVQQPVSTAKGPPSFPPLSTAVAKR